MQNTCPGSSLLVSRLYHTEWEHCHHPLRKATMQHAASVSALTYSRYIALQLLSWQASLD